MKVENSPMAERCGPGGAMPGCLDCLHRLVGDAADMAAPNDSGLRARAVETAKKVLDAADLSRITSPELANLAMRALASVTGVADPYAEAKEREMAKARETFEAVRPLLGNDLESLLELAALGNSLDFFLPSEETLNRVRRQVEGFSFFKNDAEKLGAFLAQRPEVVLYLTDNSGEIFFDLPLFEHVRGLAKRTIMVVKGGPGLNDLTRAELDKAGLTPRVGRIEDTGTDGAGVDWSSVSDEFLSLLGRADLVLAKGMANLETLSSRSLPCPVFFLFKVKCRPIQDFIGAPPESYMAMWRDRS
jgi:uncharacterized protein with ATP-grasp and redox domains